MRLKLLRLSWLALVMAAALVTAGCQRTLIYLTPQGPRLGATATPQRSASLQTAAGSVESRTSASADWATARAGQSLAEGSQLRTGEDGRAVLRLTEGSSIYVGPSTEIAIDQLNPYLDSLLTTLKLERGELWVLLKGGALDVQTPLGLATARDAYLSADLDPKTRDITVMCVEGVCGFESVLIPGGHKLVDAVDNDAPEPMAMADYGYWGINVAEATQWAYLATEAVAQGSATMIIVATPTPSVAVATATATREATAVAAVTATAIPVSSPTKAPTTAATTAASATRAASPTRAATATPVPSRTFTPRPRATNTPAPATRTPVPSPTQIPRLPTVTRPPFTPVPAAPVIGRHTVLAGETIFCIGRGYGVLPAAIAQANGLVSPFNVRAGQVLSIPAVQWVNILAGPVCAPQFTSPFPGLTVATPTSAGPTAVPLLLALDFFCASNCGSSDGDYVIHFELHASGAVQPYSYTPAQTFDEVFPHCTHPSGVVSVTSADGQARTQSWTYRDVSCP